MILSPNGKTCDDVAGIPLNTETECETAAARLGLSLVVYYKFNSGDYSDRQKGCSVDSWGSKREKRVYWNAHATGSIKTDAVAICKAGVKGFLHCLCTRTISTKSLYSLLNLSIFIHRVHPGQGLHDRKFVQ